MEHWDIPHPQLSKIKQLFSPSRSEAEVEIAEEIFSPLASPQLTKKSHPFITTFILLILIGFTAITGWYLGGQSFVLGSKDKQHFSPGTLKQVDNTPLASSSTLGAVPAENVVRERPAEGDVVILVGGRTGRDGCGGATGSSKEHTEDSLAECGAEVQKGNPPVERNIQRLFRRKEAAVMIKRCNDFGAGGVSVAIGELAPSLDITLDKVLKKYEGLDGTELAISESQERMAVVVSKDDEELFKKYAAEENLEATTVARVTGDGRIRMSWKANEILNLSRAFLDTNGAKQQAVCKVKASSTNLMKEHLMEPADYLKDLNCAGKRGLIERFDSTIGKGTVLMPLGGKYQLTPAPGMAAKLPVQEGDCNTASLMAYGYDPKVAKKSPFHGAVYAVMDSVTKIVAMGGDFRRIRLTFQEYF